MFIGKQVIILLVTLGLGLDVYAGTVSYAEGYFKIPDEMRELSADEVQKYYSDVYSKHDHTRVFEKTDSYYKTLTTVVSFLDPPNPSNCGTLQELRAFASLPEEQKSNLIRASNPSVDLNAQRITWVTTNSTPAGPYKTKIATVPLNNKAVLFLLISVEGSQYDRLLPEMTEIANSLSANPQFKLIDLPGSSTSRVGEPSTVREPTPWWTYAIGIPLAIVLFTGPSFLAFRRHMKNRYWILGMNILALFAGGFPGLILWIWAGCGKVEPKSAKTPLPPPSPESA
jgi:hypothetical protein